MLRLEERLCGSVIIHSGRSAKPQSVLFLKRHRELFWRKFKIRILEDSSAVSKLRSCSEWSFSLVFLDRASGTQPGDLQNPKTWVPVDNLGALLQSKGTQGWGRNRTQLSACLTFHTDLGCTVISSSPGYSARCFHPVRHPPQGLSSQQTSLNLQFTLVPAAFPIQSLLSGCLKETSAPALPGCSTKLSSSLSHPVLFLLFSFPAFSIVLASQGSTWISMNGTDTSGLPLSTKNCFIEPLGWKPLQVTSPIN